MSGMTDMTASGVDAVHGVIGGKDGGTRSALRICFAGRSFAIIIISPIYLFRRHG